MWEELKARHCGHSEWQIRRLITEDRIPATAAIARFIGADAYEAAGGALTRDLFAEEDESGTWFDDPALLRKLALERLEAAAEELRTKWSWAEARVEVEWTDTARFARIRPTPGEPTEAEKQEVEQLTARREALTELDEDDWTEEAEAEYERIEVRLDAIHATVAGRAVFRRKDMARAGAIVTIGDDRNMRRHPGPGSPGRSRRRLRSCGRRIGLHQRRRRRPPRPRTVRRAGSSSPLLSRPESGFRSPAAEARKRVGIGIGLGDDLRAIRTSHIKAQLADDFKAAFDVCLFQMARADFFGRDTCRMRSTSGSRETADRPPVRGNGRAFRRRVPRRGHAGDQPLRPASRLARSRERRRRVPGAPRADRRAETIVVRRLQWRARCRASSRSSPWPGPSLKPRSRGWTSTSRACTGPTKTCSGAG